MPQCEYEKNLLFAKEIITGTIKQRWDFACELAHRANRAITYKERFWYSQGGERVNDEWILITNNYEADKIN